MVASEQFSYAVEDEPGSEDEAKDRDEGSSEVGLFPYLWFLCGVSY